MSEVISDLEARQIAADWYSPGQPSLHALATTGAILLPELEFEIDRELSDVRFRNRHGESLSSDPLLDLRIYARAHGPRSPVKNWALLNW